MGNIVDEIIKGRKVFFIAPDHSLLPENYLEEYLTLGYECYFIDNDIFLPMETKVEIILSIFKDSILFFNIDAPISTIKWPSFILNLQMKYPEAIFGVLYNKRQSVTERQGIERQFLYTIGIKGGCIQLEYQKKNNFGLIEKTLYANQAMGRRKNVRAVCSSGCTFQLYNDKKDIITGKLNDISISHFSFTLDPNALSLAEYEKVPDIAFSVRGLHFRSDAVLYMMRETDLGTLFVFAFTTGAGQSGLESASRQLLIPKLYEIMSSNCNELLSKLFKAAGQKRDSEIPELGSLD
ncbi:MAG: hypothetical protein UHP28_03775 [Treponema sp.]|nr:hypothetical protein [Treponema sp.]